MFKRREIRTSERTGNSEAPMHCTVTLAVPNYLSHDQTDFSSALIHLRGLGTNTSTSSTVVQCSSSRPLVARP